MSDDDRWTCVECGRPLVDTARMDAVAVLFASTVDRLARDPRIGVTEVRYEVDPPSCYLRLIPRPEDP